MLSITINELQRDLLNYLRQVEAGETLTILRLDQPIAELRPITPSNPQLRPFGLCAGEFTVPEDFDAPLPEELIHLLESE